MVTTLRRKHEKFRADSGRGGPPAAPERAGLQCAPMTDAARPSLPDLSSPPGETILRVSELNRLARQALEQRFPLCWIAGEVSNLTRAASGHLYFTLKDEAAQVRCAMFRNKAQTLPWRLENGMKVEARALVTLYEARGDYQLNVEGLRRAGIGSLFEAFTRLRDRLLAEGLFDAARKRPLPAYPRRIGIVSSLQAAALKDILAALKRRAPHLSVVIYPTAVQGEGAAVQIAGAIGAAGTRHECDVILLARGGGSIEDLWSFNEEIVARAIRACPIPVVSGVGHETDTTIADFAADRRAATPTAAAELVSAGYMEAAQRLAALHQHLTRAMQRGLDSRAQRLDTLGYRLVHPGERIARARLAAAHLESRLTGALLRGLERRRATLAESGARLTRARPDLRRRQEGLQALEARLREAAATAVAQRQRQLDNLATHLGHLNPEAVLTRGFSIVRDAKGGIICSGAQVEEGMALALRFAVGGAEARVTKRVSPGEGNGD